jgi:uncharacterized membrane protein required for colicin V production
MTKIGWIIDIALVLLVLIQAVLGRHRGMVKTLKGMLAPVLAVMLALTLNPMVTGWVENMGAFDSVEQWVEDLVGDKLDTPEDLPSDAEMQELTEEQKAQLTDMFAQFGMDADQALSMITQGENGNRKETVVNLITHTIARAIAYAVTFLGAMILLLILFSILGLIFNSAALKDANRLLGTVLGAVKGFVFVLIISFIAQKVATMLCMAVPKLLEYVNASHLIPCFAKWIQFFIG